jgi:hypothetical protein
MGRVSLSHRCTFLSLNLSAGSLKPVTDLQRMEQVAVKVIDTSEKITQVLIEIVQSLGRWNKHIDLFAEHVRVREAAAHLFSQIINFLVRARIYYQKPRPCESIQAHLDWFL